VSDGHIIGSQKLYDLLVCLGIKSGLRAADSARSGVRR
jgi:hypothetical protein